MGVSICLNQRHLIMAATLTMNPVFSFPFIILMISTLTLTRAAQRNVRGDALALCSTDPLTGWHRDGYCNTDERDRGSHVVCAEMTAEFLAYTKSLGNDLSTAHPPSFPGLDPGDFWCLCAARWREALDAGVAPRVNIDATHANALNSRGVTLDVLEANSVSTAPSSSSDGTCHANDCAAESVDR